MKLSDYVWDFIADYTDCVFMVVGGANSHLADSLSKNSRLKFVCVQHEQAAAMAAAYYYRVRERVALCLVTTGAGSTNAITGVMAAWMDSIPLLVISGNEASKYYEAGGRGFGFQGYKSAEVAKHFTKLALSGPLVPSLLDSVLRVALEPRQGPVWLDFPKDLQSAVA